MLHNCPSKNTSRPNTIVCLQYTIKLSTKLHSFLAYGPTLHFSQEKFVFYQPATPNHFGFGDTNLKILFYQIVLKVNKLKTPWLPSLKLKKKRNSSEFQNTGGIFWCYDGWFYCTVIYGPRGCTINKNKRHYHGLHSAWSVAKLISLSTTDISQVIFCSEQLFLHSGLFY